MAIVRRVAIEHPRRDVAQSGTSGSIKIHSASMESYASIFDIVADVKPMNAIPGSSELCLLFPLKMSFRPSIPTSNEHTPSHDALLHNMR